VHEIKAAGSQALAVPAHCAVEDEVGQVVERALERFGRIDTYVANAIVTVYAETFRYEPDELRRIISSSRSPTIQVPTAVSTTARAARPSGRRSASGAASGRGRGGRGCGRRRIL
jgi:NAD(P)-dependent dehydrogenase (short-subunit alcohol dehydrogenase family)